MKKNYGDIARSVYYDEKNMKRATMIWNDLKNRGSLDAEEYLALSSYLRFYKRKNIKKAVKMFKKFYKHGWCLISLPYLGECYYCGIGVKRDYTKAKKILYQSLKHFDLYDSYFTNPKFYLGEMYLLGNGTEKDYSKAKKYFNECYNEYKYLKLYIYPYKLYYYLGKIKKIEDNNIVNENNCYFNLIFAQILNNISNQDIKINTIEDLYKAINKYSYRKFIKNQKIKEIREFEKRIGYLNKSEFTEMIDFLKIKIENYMKNDKFCKMFSIYHENHIDWFFKIILESYKYKNIKDYINNLIEQNDYETVDIIGTMFLDGIVIEKDENKGKEYKEKAKKIRKDFFLQNIPNES